jgi:hypothetical protein
MRQDRFLLIVILAITGLVMLSLVIFFIRGGSQEYSLESGPSGVVRNYLLALQKGDYPRAYAYLAEQQGKPDFERFQSDFLTLKREISNVSLQLGSVEQTGEQALVFLTIIHSGNGPFGDVWREDTNALLTSDGTGSWKITRMPYPFWGTSWYPIKMPTP